jgi:hypothetical protein
MIAPPPDLRPVSPFVNFLGLCRRCWDSTLRWATAILLSIHDLSTRCCINYAVEEMSLNEIRYFGTSLQFEASVVNSFCFVFLAHAGFGLTDRYLAMWCLGARWKVGWLFNCFLVSWVRVQSVALLYICVCFYTLWIQTFNISDTHTHTHTHIYIYIYICNLRLFLATNIGAGERSRMRGSVTWLIAL